MNNESYKHYPCSWRVQGLEKGDEGKRRTASEKLDKLSSAKLLQYTEQWKIYDFLF